MHLAKGTTWSPRTGTLDCTFKVTREAYVLVVAADNEDRVHVVYPLSPEETGLTPANESVRTNRISLGVPQPTPINGASRRFGRGILFAVASAEPLKLEKLKDERGSWDERHLIRILESSPTAAALGREVTEKGQKFSVDSEVARGG